MRKALLLIGVLALALLITYFLLHKSSTPGTAPDEKDAPLTIGSKSSAFNQSFSRVLGKYYQLTDRFAKGDTVEISLAARGLSTAIDSIRFEQFKADSSILLTAVNVAQSVQGEILGLIGETTMEQKKRELNLITEDLYSLIRVVRYDGAVIYHLRSTSVFADSSEAYWLSDSPQIVNPYMEKNALAGNGEVSDSLHFSTP